MDRLESIKDYKITLLWNHEKNIIGWYGAIHKRDSRWKLTSYHKTRILALSEALQMIDQDLEAIK